MDCTALRGCGLPWHSLKIPFSIFYFQFSICICGPSCPLNFAFVSRSYQFKLERRLHFDSVVRSGRNCRCCVVCRCGRGIMHSVFFSPLLLLLLRLLFRGSALLIQALRITFKLNCTLAKSFALSKAASDLTPSPFLHPPWYFSLFLCLSP